MKSKIITKAYKLSDKVDCLYKSVSQSLHRSLTKLSFWY